VIDPPLPMLLPVLLGVLAGGTVTDGESEVAMADVGEVPWTKINLLILAENDAVTPRTGTI